MNSVIKPQGKIIIDFTKFFIHEGCRDRIVTNTFATGTSSTLRAVFVNSIRSKLKIAFRTRLLRIFCDFRVLWVNIIKLKIIKTYVKWATLILPVGRDAPKDLCIARWKYQLMWVGLNYLRRAVATCTVFVKAYNVCDSLWNPSAVALSWTNFACRRNFLGRLA